MKKILLFILAVTMLLPAAGCEAPSASGGGAEITAEYGEDALRLPEENLSAWVVYWGLQNTVPEMDWLRRRAGALSWFAAYFSPEERLFLPETLLAFYEETAARFPDWTREDYLTIVNDIDRGGGVSSLKDTGLLRRIFSDAARMDAHAEEVVKLAKDHGFDGVELDYEALHSDMALWESYLAFIERVFEKAGAQGLRLRVLLEPNTPAEHLSFPEGPEYVMMCYNLYGTGTETGPKADPVFLQKMLEKMEALPGEKGFALATGGYDWKQGEPGRQITEQEAYYIRTDRNLYVRRDESSFALTFEYRDEENLPHTVWYADLHTISHWAEIIRRAGAETGADYGILLWRLGGNLFPPAP